jgi:hypothetical protein
MPYAALWLVACWLVALAAYITHIVVCLKASSYALLVIGCIIFPVGVIDGWCHWLGIL